MALAQPIMTQFFSKSVNFLIRPCQAIPVNMKLFAFGWGDFLFFWLLDLLLKYFKWCVVNINMDIKKVNAILQTKLQNWFQNLKIVKCILFWIGCNLIQMQFINHITQKLLFSKSYKSLISDLFKKCSLAHWRHVNFFQVYIKMYSWGH